jgi:hypothetical protein
MTEETKSKLLAEVQHRIDNDDNLHRGKLIESIKNYVVPDDSATLRERFKASRFRVGRRKRSY